MLCCKIGWDKMLANPTARTRRGLWTLEFELNNKTICYYLENI